MRRLSGIAIAGLLACGAARLARAQAAPPPTKEGIEFFESKIRPVLVDKCYECHSEVKKKVKGKYRVDDFASMFKGGESGKPGIVPGKPDDSQLYFSLTYKDQDTPNHDALLMPPPKNGRKKQLPDNVLQDFRKWIEMGAPVPQNGGKADATPKGEAKEHWAFVPPKDQPIPQVKATSWVKNAIDSFVLAKLEAQNLHPSNPADKRTLIRRATYDLTGLPPTEPEVQAFEADNSLNAFERVVDRLLASPRYGERWGRYWLDVARYSDTKGYVFEEERRYPYSYTYRDWVIGAFNEDLPYDQFLIQQIAADKIDRHGDDRSLAAEGFLTLGRRFLNNTPDIVDDRIDVVCRGTMALTVGCARCHDHKFDPIPQKDYYALYAVFANSVEPKEPPLLGAPENTPEYQAFKKALDQKEAAVENYRTTTLTAHAVALRQPQTIAGYLLAAQTDAQAPGIVPFETRRWKTFLEQRATAKDKVFAAWRAYAAAPAAEFAAKAKEITETIQTESDKHNPLVAKVFATAPASLNEVAERYGKLLASFEGDKPRDNADEEALRLVLRGEGSPAVLSGDHQERVFSVPEIQHLRALRRDADALRATSPSAPPRAMALQDAPSIGEQHVFLRGNPGNQGDLVKPHFLTILSDGNAKPFTDGSGRLEMARDIASKNNPLTARVIVNRVWLHHFGQGLVRTPSDFGMRSDPPTHPELLDWLAVRFMQDGWSIKKLQKLIMLSATYQQGSEYDPVVAKVDPDNKLLSHFSRQRLDWEATRDSLLAAAGRLDTTMGGRPVEILDSPRRTVYGFIDRQNLPGVFRAFDFATPDATSPQRFTTTVPQQALFLMNSPFSVQQAQALVHRPEVANETDTARRIARIYQIVYQRTPTPDEIALASQFIRTEEGNGKEDDHAIASVWQYGYGSFDEAAHRVAHFTPLAHFTGGVWQGGMELPDPALGYLSLTAGGGHPGRDVAHAAVRRWVSPINGLIHITGIVSHNETQGDGVHARIVSSRSGELASWNILHMQAATDVDNIDVKKGDTIDFVVDCRGSDYYDSFGWSPVIKVASPPVAGNDGPAVWNAATDFAGAKAKPLDAWVKYAQVLLESNEFVFVD
ncbi:MAG TPA: PSD1 and planctomycete cytochrome C domain-containing protein [Tepidisphaeraceae bacterium]|jgi:hypothetical protein